MPQATATRIKDERKVSIFRCHYPGHPSTCVTDKVGEELANRGYFESWERSFREIAKTHGLDAGAGRFTAYVERRKGCVWDHAALILPDPAAPNGPSYYRIAFYS
jgi:hypothetical protein